MASCTMSVKVPGSTSCLIRVGADQPAPTDPFISFDSYLAQMPFDFNLNGQPTQPLELSDTYAFADVNLDLDQDWAWFPSEQQIPVP